MDWSAEDQCPRAPVAVSSLKVKAERTPSQDRRSAGLLFSSSGTQPPWPVCPSSAKLRGTIENSS